jgi:hypothetical protein
MAMIANRYTRPLGINRSAERQSDEMRYELFAVCTWSVLAVALVALVLWLALGGTI